jgi:hypothetical protein
MSLASTVNVNLKDSRDKRRKGMTTDVSQQYRSRWKIPQNCTAGPAGGLRSGAP